jgi:hypothetical protein
LYSKPGTLGISNNQCQGIQQDIEQLHIKL